MAKYKTVCHRRSLYFLIFLYIHSTEEIRKICLAKKQQNLFYSTFSKKAETRPQAVGFSQTYSAIFSKTAEISA
jgi:hypothetical protein